MKKKSKWLADMMAPVDPKTFVFASNVYQAAARMTMPVENPGAKPLVQDEKGRTYSLSDIPMNRGMLAVVGQLREMKVDNPAAYTARLMHMGEIFQEKERFAEFFKPSDEDDSVMVSDALLMAAGVAKFIVNDKHMGFDLDDVLLHARRFEAEEDGE